MALVVTRFWIGLWTLLAAGGWLLSAAGALNRTGYAALFAVGVVIWWRVGLPERWPRIRARRWRRPLPLAAALLMGAVVLAGILYPPNNFDALTYRLPRILHWLAEGRWHWIATDFHRLNTRAVNSEWAMTPFLLFLHSERWVWVLNAGCFAALPGLVFVVLSGAGISRRAAAHWMWVLPSGYIFALQAAGDANDLPGAFFVLAAVALALRAGAKQNGADLLWSMLALSLATGLKASNAPLALPWLLAAWPARRLLGARPALTAIVLILGALCSFLPSAVQNYRHCGDWTGARLEIGGEQKPSPGLCLATNAIRLTVQNANPPVFPFASAWNAASAHWLPASFRAAAAKTVEAPDALFTMVELPLEDNGGTGPFWLALIAGCGAARLLAPKPARADALRLRLLRWSPWVALAVFVTKMSLAAASRLAAPFALLLPLPFLAGTAAARAVRSKWWRALSLLQMATTLLVLIVTPARPLFPALTLLNHLPEKLRASPMVVRAQRVYAVFRARPDSLAPVRALLPAGVARAGLVVNIEPEASLWRPYGTRSFHHVKPGDTPESVRARGIEYLAIRAGSPTPETPWALPPWMKDFPLQVTGHTAVQVLASEPVEAWVVARLLPAPARPLP